MTTPRMPPSRTSRLLPRPSQKSGVPAGSEREEREQVRAVARLKNTSAGPPTCHEVWRDIGSSRFTRGANSPGRCGDAGTAAHGRRLGCDVVAARPARHACLRAAAAPNFSGSACDTALMMPAPIVTSTSPALQHGAQRLVERFHFLDEHRLHLAARAHGAADRAPVGRRDRRFACRVHLGHEQRVARGQHGGEIIEQVARARVAMRLEREHHAPARVTLADGIERRRDFGRVMPVVIDDRHRIAAAPCHRRWAV